MASQLTKRGYKYRVLPTNDADTFNDFLNDDSEFNIKKLDTDLEKLDDKVLLEGERQQNFNFIENKVVNGVGSQINTTEKYLNINVSTIKRIVYKGSYYNTSGIKNLFSFGGITLGIDSSNVPYLTSNETSYKGLGNLVFTNAKEIKVIIDFIDNRTMEIMFFNDIGKTKSVIKFNSEFSGGSVYLYGRQNVSGGCVFSTTGEEHEIEHNFSVINNPTSIKELHTTDSTGKTSILKLGSDEDHVEMASGRTLREEYMGVLKTMGKEFTSADGSPIQVPNGIEARLISGEIKGQTVKNYYGYDNMKHIHPYVKSYDGWGTVTLPANDQYSAIQSMGNQPTVQSNTKYTVKYEMKNNTTNFDLAVGFGKTYSEDILGARQQMTSKGEFTFSTPENSEGKIFALRIYRKNSVGTQETCDIKILSITLESEAKYVSDFINSGLSSTQTIVSNNGQPYPIYEPTIQGKTRILNAQGVEVEAGTAGATVVSLKPTDNKLPNLGSAGNSKDVIYRDASKCVLNTSSTVVDGSTNIILFSTQPTDTTLVRFQVESVTDCKPSGGVISNTFNSNSTLSGEGVFLHNTHGKINIVIKKSKLSTADVAGFKTWLASNQTVVRYQLATPQEIQLTEKQLKAYDAYRKIITLNAI